MIRKEFVFEDERPFVSCHASTVLPLSDGTVLAAWFGGPHEGHPDVAIWLSRRTGGRWSDPVRVADQQGLCHWNPVLALSPSGVLHLFYKVGGDCMRWVTRLLTSADGGLSWSTPRELPSQDGFPAGPVRSKPIVLGDGTWLAPTSRETGTAWDAAVWLSRDDGQSWTLGGPVPLEHGELEGKGVIQPTIWQTASGDLRMLLRSTEGFVYLSTSADGGRSWSPAAPTALVNNNSGIDAARLTDGGVVLAHNPVSGNWAKRTPLVLSVSEDNGESWREHTVLEDEDPAVDEERVELSRVHRANEFSYPAVFAAGDTIHITYTWKRQRICYRKGAINPS